jgi:glycosyltransferase involved in cell wall biosynthesis
VLEALAARKPVIAARVGGIPEVLGPDSSALAAPNDAQSLADVMTIAMTEEDWAAKVMPDAGAFKTAFSTSTMAGSIMRLYRQLVPELASRQGSGHNRS